MHETPNDITAFYLLGTLFVFILVFALMIYVYLHQVKVSAFRLRMREEEIKKQQELFFALQEGEEKERRRLAEELHDGIGAKLSGLRMTVEYLKDNNSLAGEDKEVFGKLSSGMNEAIEELRSISQNLQPAFLVSKGLHHAVSGFVEKLNLQGTCRYDLYVQLDPDLVGDKLQLVIFRMVSELLNNVSRHAKATIASVQLMGGEEGVQIMVEDNGQGFREGASGGIGLMNLRNRVDMCGGKLSIDTGTKGTIVIVELPITDQV